jgi:hypothetical protein
MTASPEPAPSPRACLECGAPPGAACEAWCTSWQTRIGCVIRFLSS